MRPNLKTLVFLTLIAAFAATVASAGPPKVKVCHVPPDNPANFHTITVNQNAVPAHLGHGDILGACADNCETLCDDGNPCTIDGCDPGTEQCSLDHPPVDCDDQNLCTVDSCNPANGACVNVQEIVCDDNDLCTFDACDPLTGLCGTTDVVCDPGEECDAATGECVTPDPCDPNPCQNGGLCADLGGDQFLCLCPPEWTGEICETPVPTDPCDPNPCMNGGSCGVLPDGTAACRCPSGTVGDYCELPPDPCEGVVCEPLDQCHVAGTCTDGVCDDPIATPGTLCDDGNPNTVNDSCNLDGVCTGDSTAPPR